MYLLFSGFRGTHQPPAPPIHGLEDNVPDIHDEADFDIPDTQAVLERFMTHMSKLADVDYPGQALSEKAHSILHKVREIVMWGWSENTSCQGPEHAHIDIIKSVAHSANFSISCELGVRYPSLRAMMNRDDLHLRTSVRFQINGYAYHILCICFVYTTHIRKYNNNILLIFN